MAARLNEAGELTDDVRMFAHRLVNGVLEQRTRLDALIQQYAPEWPLEQMAIIDRNILRIAIYEFALTGDTPIKVAINEAIELAKDYGSESASRFVNGVLGALAVHEHHSHPEHPDPSSTSLARPGASNDDETP